METLAVVVGGQFGSEAKGHVAQRIIHQYAADRTGGTVASIRVGGPNAGHTAYDADGGKWALRQVPVGVVEPNVRLGIAAGSEVDQHVLIDEIRRLEVGGHSVCDRLWIDSEATVLTACHRREETGLVAGIGSTGKGIGACRAARLMRNAHRVCDDDSLVKELIQYGVRVCDVALVARSARHVVLEGTQGYGLGLHSGFYPYVTAGDCRAIDVLAQAGISPWEVPQEKLAVWVVLRPFPIRVAGTSGPLLAETTWCNLGLPEETTTVTGKTRRVGMWDSLLVMGAIQANGGGKRDTDGVVRVALTMADQLDETVLGGTTDEVMNSAAVRDYVRRIKESTGAPVRLITTSPTTGVFIDG